MKKKYIISTWKRAIYIGPADSRPVALSFGMTGYYDPDHSTFIPDGQKSAYHAVPLECFYFTQY
jgi:hypothetical protein